MTLRRAALSSRGDFSASLRFSTSESNHHVTRHASPEDSALFCNAAYSTVFSDHYGATMGSMMKVPVQVPILDLKSEYAELRDEILAALDRGGRRRE